MARMGLGMTYDQLGSFKLTRNLCAVREQLSAHVEDGEEKDSASGRGGLFFSSPREAAREVAREAKPKPPAAPPLPSTGPRCGK
jgi:hypothetical protein